MTDFSSQQVQARILMALFRLQRRQCASGFNSGYHGSSTCGKAAAAGAIETMAYELGAGLGIAIFGLLLSRSFSASILPPAGLNPQEMERASSSMGRRYNWRTRSPSSLSEALLTAAREAFTGHIAWP